MAAVACVVLCGNSVFLAGIKAELERNREVDFELITVAGDCPDVTELIRVRKPGTVLFDLTMTQPDFAIPLLREQPDLLLVGVDPSRDEMLVLTSQPVQALALHDLVHLIFEASHLQERKSK